MEVNKEAIYDKSNSLAALERVLNSYKGRLLLAVLPCNRRKSTTSSPHDKSQPSTRPSQRQGTQKTTELYAKVCVQLVRLQSGKSLWQINALFNRSHYWYV